MENEKFYLDDIKLFVQLNTPRSAFDPPLHWAIEKYISPLIKEVERVRELAQVYLKGKRLQLDRIAEQAKRIKELEGDYKKLERYCDDLERGNND